MGLAGCAGSNNASGSKTSSQSTTAGKTSTQSSSSTGGKNQSVNAASVAGGDIGLIDQAVMNQGYDSKHGFTLETKKFVSPPKAQQQLVYNKSIDTSWMGEIIATRLRNKGNKIQLVGPYMNYNSFILTKSGSGISDPQDLAKKRISWASKESDGWLKVAVILKTVYGVDPSKLKFQSVAPPASIDLLAKDQLDAILLPDFLAIKALTKYDFKIVFYPGKVWKKETGYNLSTVSLAWRNSWYNDNKALGLNFLKATFDSQKYLAGNMDTVLKKYADFLGIKNDKQMNEAKKLYAITNPFDVKWSENYRKSGIEVAQRAYDMGLIDKKPTTAIYNNVLPNGYNA